MSQPIACSTLLAEALADNCGRDLAVLIVAHPWLVSDAEPMLSPGTKRRLFRFAIGADEPGPRELAFLRTVAELLLIEELA